MGCSPRPSSSPRPFSVSVLASPAAPRDVSPTPGDLLGASFSIICSVLSSKAVVRREVLRDVVGRCRYRANNHLDHKYKPRPVNVIICSAKKKIGEEMEYRLLGKNCEHFVTDLRYGVPHSRQVAVSLVLSFPTCRRGWMEDLWRPASLTFWDPLPLKVDRDAPTGRQEESGPTQHRDSSPKKSTEAGGVLKVHGPM
ncbi:phospholipase A and acyltransferase 5-like isoform X1 [Acinonyx jubatus]|uniref:Phospholipase A and acyltransferase 5-like isoform X1 n=1 Tax=Acinonyx jubatus TaxID=32536 RepID=A0A6J0A2B2_ACIJB|nr:phospholipase A and acyltransferase 5-like isoform X1 [Acinonyx jubatus]